MGNRYTDYSSQLKGYLRGETTQNTNIYEQELTLYVFT